MMPRRELGALGDESSSHPLSGQNIAEPEGEQDQQHRRSGAGGRSRTLDLRITNALLYQLSYTGTNLESGILREVGAQIQRPRRSAKL